MLSLIANVPKRRLESDCERMPSGERTTTHKHRWNNGSRSPIASHNIIELNFLLLFVMRNIIRNAFFDGDGCAGCANACVTPHLAPQLIPNEKDETSSRTILAFTYTSDEENHCLYNNLI